MKNNLFISQLGEYFVVYLPNVHDVSKKTIAAYGDAFAIFFQFCEEKYKLPHYKITYKLFSSSMFDEFLLWLKTERNYAPASVRLRVSAITTFLRYASRRELSALNAYSAATKIELPNKNQAPFPYFTKDEMTILLSLPNSSKYLGDRDLVLLSFLYETAARAQELCDACVSDIRFGKTTKVRLRGKGGKTREIPISVEVANLLKYHIKNKKISENCDNNIPLFLSQTNEKMTTACVRSLVGKYVKLAKMQNPQLFPEYNYSPHSFRHSKAVHMVESGINLIYIRNFLGHASVSSTEIYARVGQEALTKALTNRSIPQLAQSPPSVGNKSQCNMPEFIEKARKIM